MSQWNLKPGGPEGYVVHYDSVKDLMNPEEESDRSIRFYCETEKQAKALLRELRKVKRFGYL